MASKFVSDRTHESSGKILFNTIRHEKTQLTGHSNCKITAQTSHHLKASTFQLPPVWIGVKRRSMWGGTVGVIRYNLESGATRQVRVNFSGVWGGKKKRVTLMFSRLCLGCLARLNYSAVSWVWTQWSRTFPWVPRLIQNCFVRSMGSSVQQFCCVGLFSADPK